jgi:hypothetical protein
MTSQCPRRIRSSPAQGAATTEIALRRLPLRIESSVAETSVAQIAAKTNRIIEAMRSTVPRRNCGPRGKIKGDAKRSGAGP